MTTSVDVQGMQLAQEDFQQALDQMNSVYSAMTEEQDTLSANWSGMAASSFGQALNAWLDDLYQIRQELVVMTESLSTHTGIYSDANEASQQVVTAFQQGLDGLEGLPVEGMVALRHEMGTLLPERGIETRRSVVEGKLLPDRMDALSEPSMPGLPALRDSVEAVPAGILPSETMPRFLAREQPALPLGRLEDVPAEPLQPTLLSLPEEPLQPALPSLPAEPLQPTLLSLPEEPLQPALLSLPSLPAEPLQPALPSLPAEPLQPALRDVAESP